MPDFSSTIPFAHIQVPGSFVDDLIRRQSEKLFTGLMRLQYPTGENLVSFFLEGIQQKLYRSPGQTMEVIPRQAWSETMSRPDASIGFLSMPVEALRIMHLAYEAPIVHVERAQLKTDDLGNSVGEWVTDRSPSLLDLLSDPIQKLFVLTGYSSIIFEEMTFAGDEARFSINDVSFPRSLPPAEYQVTRYVGDGASEVWQEYQLRLAFNPLIRTQVIRFSELAGRTLADRLCEQLSTRIGNAGLKIGVTMNGVANRHYFIAIDDAKNAYFEILRNLNTLASAAIGPRMASALAHDALHKLNPYHRALLQRHIFDFYGFESTVAPTRGTQR